MHTKTKITLILITILTSIYFVRSFSFAKEPEGVKIGIFDIQKIVRESKTGQQAKAIFEKELSEKRKQLQEKEQSVKAQEESLKKETQLPPAKRKEKEEEFQQELKELRRLRQDFEEELKKKDAQLASKLIRDVLDITRKIGEQERYTIILQKGMDVVYTDKTVDITSKIMERLDAQQKR